MSASSASASPTAHDPVLFTFFNEVGIIDQLARTAFERVLPRGMTVPQFSVLNHFVRLGGERTPARLASAFQVSRATMTNTLKRLEASGFIAVRPDPKDGRSKLIVITDAGRAMREECVRALAPLLAELTAMLDVEAIGAILPTLQEVRATLDENRDLADRVMAAHKPAPPRDGAAGQPKRTPG